MNAQARQSAISAGVLLTGGGVVLAALQMSSDAGYAGVGPNFLPLVVGGLLALCGLGLLREAFTGGWRDMEEPPGAARGDWVGFAWVSAGLCVNALLITRIGFVLGCALCFVLAVHGLRWSRGARGLRVRQLAADMALGLAISAPVFWMFGQGLGISLPAITSTGWL